jgi:hypothetical protein
MESNPTEADKGSTKLQGLKWLRRCVFPTFTRPSDRRPSALVRIAVFDLGFFDAIK